ncbi:MAG: dicarboxylate/amino acid:cation symporter [Acidobacteriota bacterium]|nr:dicarboxylate/amino acid:cation symporter [Acidobacteriota bacterium]
MSGKPFYKTLYFQVLVAIAIGVLLGYFKPGIGAEMKPFGDGFIKLIKMMIAPIIFCTVVLGISGMENMKSVGKTGALAILYFEVLSTISLVIGLIIVDAVHPGLGMNINPATLDAKAVAAYTGPGKMHTATQFLLEIIPDTIIGAFSSGDILSVLFIAVLFGFALHLVGPKGKMVHDFIEQLSHLLFRVVNMIMRVAPIGAFGAMAFTVGKYGVGTLRQLGWVMVCFYSTCLIFIFVVLGTVALIHGFSIWKYLKFIKEELFIVLGTSSSEAALPRMMAKMELIGVDRTVVGLVIPAGYSFNLDGTSIYLTMAAMFIAQATNTHLSLGQQIYLLAILMLTSKGAAGVTGSGFIVLAATLSAVGSVPVAGVALILGIDRFMSEARALTNLIGNGVATIVVGHWCKQLDEKKMREYLHDGVRQQEQEPELVV